MSPQVKERKDKYPYQINKVPIKTGNFDHLIIAAPVAIIIARPNAGGSDDQINHTSGYVLSVKAGNHEEGCTKLWCPHRITPGSYTFFYDQFGPLKGLHTNK
jgi:hypothetical protein